MAECLRCGEVKLTEQPCPRCGSSFTLGDVTDVAHRCTVAIERDILLWLHAEQKELLAWCLSSLVRNHPDYQRQLDEFLAGMRENIAAGCDPLTGEPLKGS